MKFRYKPEDFDGMFNHSDCKSSKENQQKCIDDAVRRCNRLLEENEKTLPVITITGKKKELDVRYDALPENFKAGLWGIEEIK